MNNKEWNDTKQANQTQKIVVDFEHYLFNDQCIESQHRDKDAPDILVLNSVINRVKLTTSDILMMALTLEVTPTQYEFFYNKHILQK